MRPTKSSHCFEVEGKQVKFSSNFDSGNLRSVTQTAVFEFLVESSHDNYQIPSSNKSFFHFRVQNYPNARPIKIVIRNLSLLECIKQERRILYKPWYSYNGQDYQRLTEENQKIISNGTQLYLQINFMMNKHAVYFSFSLPYSYERYMNMIRDLPDFSKDFYIKKEVLCYTKNLHLVYMITITSFDRKTDFHDQIGSTNNGVILPEKHLDEQRTYFDKPVILLSARVHPGESPSSWAIEGIVKFLVGETEEAKILRKYFQIIIVPMLNPDGVYQGMYRLDTEGHNLNRYYLVSDNRQPSIYSMKHLIKHYNTTKRLLFYFDFHGHPSFKGSFLYGNAIDDIAYQAEAQLFGRIMSLNCDTFQEKYCIFDRQQMSSKDRYDMYTKEGCARVYAFKTANILHSYTVEMGFHGCTNFPEGSRKNTQSFYYGIDDYYIEGVAVLKSVIQACGLMKSTIPKKELRKEIAVEILTREERFKKQDKNANIKKKNVNQIIQNQYWAPLKLKYFTVRQASAASKIRKISKSKVISGTSIVSTPFIHLMEEAGKSTTISRNQFSEKLKTQNIQICQQSTTISKNCLENKRKKIQMRHMIFTTKKYKQEQQKSISKKEQPRQLKKIQIDKIEKKIDKIDTDLMEKLIKNQKTLEKPRKSYEVKILSSRNKQSESSFVRPNQNFQQLLFNDLNIRKSSSDINDCQPNNYCVYSAEKMSFRVQELKQIFKMNSGNQMTSSKKCKEYKKYSSFFN